MQEAVQLDTANDVIRTVVAVVREGDFSSRSPVTEVDEAEIFEGKDNRLRLTQTYTKRFQCEYELMKYPFDTQVN